MKERVIPLVIKKESGRIVDCCDINQKGLKKSLENGVLWVLHGDTGRLLPYSEDASFIRIDEKEKWAEAVVGESFTQAVVDNCGKLVETVENSDSGDIDKTDENEAAAGSVLLELAEVIAKRHQDMPEGSYTTHLFKSGAEKIRKKTGEEAVELILASERKEIVYESADLIYHMMVLLESENISISEVIKELEGRK